MASTILFPNIESLYRGKKVTGRQKVPVKSIDGEGKVVGLYFSAFWCPPCRDFTPKLILWYKRLVGKLGPNKLEIVYITCDRNSENFDEHFDSMPWLTLSYSEGALQASLINVLTCYVRMHTLFYCIFFHRKSSATGFKSPGYLPWSWLMLLMGGSSLRLDACLSMMIHKGHLSHGRNRRTPRWPDLTSGLQDPPNSINRNLVQKT